MPELQWPYIIRLLAVVNLSGVLMAMTICLVFYYRYHTNLFGGQVLSDSVNPGFMGLMAEENLMDVVVPAFVIADVVSLLVGLWVSLYFSRKLSVPIYRISKWAEIVASGDLTFTLKFRPGDDLQSLENACNAVTDTYARVILDLRRQITEANLPLGGKLDSVKTRTKQSLP